ncbi:DUF4083 family protein [Lentibacillus halodurans]|uniref:DUF4083 family protein n=1 Tax=Lentibacillus halodurans TaxID=237679 RepID=UPI000B7C6A09
MAGIGGINIGDVIFQLILLLVLIAIVVGVISLIVMFRRRSNRLNKVEKKLDRVPSEDDKKR